MQGLCDRLVADNVLGVRGTYPMNSLDMLLADSNTERSQYKHSELKAMRAIQEASEQDSKGD
jgi:hypothetical protein